MATVSNWIDHLSASEVAGAVYPGVGSEGILVIVGIVQLNSSDKASIGLPFLKYSAISLFSFSVSLLAKFYFPVLSKFYNNSEKKIDIIKKIIHT